MDSNTLTNILEQLEELQTIQERENKILSEYQAKREECQKVLQKEKRKMEKWKKRKIEHSIDVLEKEIEIREGNELLEKLAKELLEAESEHSRVMDDKRSEEEKLRQWREMFSQEREKIANCKESSRQTFLKLEICQKLEHLKAEKNEIMAKVEYLQAQELAWQSDDEEYTRLKQRTDVLEAQARKHAQHLERIEADTRIHEQRCDMWNLRTRELAERVGMMKEELRGMCAANAELNEAAVQLEHKVQMQKQQ